MKDYNLLIGEELRIQRLIKHKTLNQIAAIVGLSPNTLGYYEKGKISISVDNLIKVCDAIGINYIDVLEKIQKL